MTWESVEKQAYDLHLQLLRITNGIRKNGVGYTSLEHTKVQDLLNRKEYDELEEYLSQKPPSSRTVARSLGIKNITRKSKEELDEEIAAKRARLAKFESPFRDGRFAVPCTGERDPQMVLRSETETGGSLAQP